MCLHSLMDISVVLSLNMASCLLHLASVRSNDMGLELLQKDNLIHLQRIGLF